MKNFTNIKEFKLNFGPQHPSAHGVLRLILTLDGERIQKADPHIGLLHRGTEKLIENKTFLQALPYFDRLDYVSMMVQEHAYCLNIEKAGKIFLPKRAQFIRVIFSELTRILNHLMSITTHALDVGAFTPFLWAFEEREYLMQMYEKVSGARMHAAYFRPGGVNQDLNTYLLTQIYDFCLLFWGRINEIEELLTNNRIWRQRLAQIGIANKKEAKTWSFSGVMARAAGLNWDLRKSQPYEVYNEIKFKIPVAFNGDCYDRYLIRIQEMRESVIIILQAVNNIPSGMVKFPGLLQKVGTKSMEDLIKHFKEFSGGLVLNYFSTAGVGIEAPKGELYVYNNYNQNKLFRCSIRPPGFAHLQALEFLAKGHFVADVVALIGTQDIVFGEIDR